MELDEHIVGTLPRNPRMVSEGHDSSSCYRAVPCETALPHLPYLPYLPYLPHLPYLPYLPCLPRPPVLASEALRGSVHRTDRLRLASVSAPPSSASRAASVAGGSADR